MSFDEWKEFSITELGRVVTGKTPPTKDVINFGSKYPFITPVDMTGEKNIYNTSRGLSETGGSVVKNCLLPMNTICVSCIGSDLGKVVKTTRDSFTNQQINSIVCNEDVDPDFVYYALTYISPELKSVGHHSTAVPIINKTDFSKFVIKAPNSKGQQKKLSSILCCLDNKIELNRQTNQTLEAIAQALFKEWFVDFNFPGATGEMVDSELGLIPNGWRIGKVVEIVELNPRLSLKKGSTAKYVEMKNLSQSTLSIEEFIDREFTSGSKFQNHDTLLARITPCLENGKTGFVDFLSEDEIGWGSTEFIVLRGKTVSPYFVYCLSRFQKFRDFAIQSMVGSSGRQRVVESILEDYDILIPPTDLMTKYHEAVQPIFQNIKVNHVQAGMLSQMRDHLLPKLMKGEIIIN